MRILITTLGLVVIQSLSAQHSLRGRVFDAKNNTPLPFSSVMVLYFGDSSLVDGTITIKDGSFIVEKLKSGHYLLLVKRIGHRDLLLDKFELSGDLDLGILKLRESEQQLEEVVVSTSRSTVETQLGKRVLNVGEDLSSTGASVIEALERIPSVRTDIQGNINIRGSNNVIIYVNGKETRRDGRSLRYLSAGALQKIEVITNPSAKYDAEGVGGIINLIFKKDYSREYKLEVVSSITDPGRWSSGINNQISSRKFTGYLNANISRSNYENSDTQVRDNELGELRRYENLVFGSGNGVSDQLTAGLTFEEDTTLSMNLEFNYWRWLDKEDRVQTNNFLNQTQADRTFSLLNFSRELEDEISFSFSTEKKWSDEKQLKFLVNAGGEDEENDAVYNRERLDLSNSPLEQSINGSDETESQRIYQFTLDYIAPFFAFGDLESGVKFDNVNYDISQSLDFVDEELFLPRNDFHITLNKYALYFIHHKKWDRLEYGAGLRLEHFSTNGSEKSTQQFNEQSVTKLFPSIQLVYKVADNHSLAFNYSRRINRPGFFDLNPFVSFTDPLILSTGNPNLEPEFANSYEMGYQSSLGTFVFDVTLFHRTTTNLIQQTVSQFDAERLLLSYTNYGRRDNSGIEISSSVQLFKRLELWADFSLYHTSFRSDSSDIEVRYNNQTTWHTNTRQRLNLENNWTIELSQTYRAPRIGVQSRDLEYHLVNASVRKSIQNNRLIFTLNYRDIFDTQNFSSEFRGDDFEITSRYKFQSRRLTFEVRYKIFD